MYLFQFSTRFEQPRAHRQENQLYQYYIWYMSLCVGDRFLCRSTCILLWFLVNDQLDEQFFSMSLFQFSTCFKQPHAHHQENQLYQYNIWYMSLYVGDRFLCRSDLHTKRSPTQSDRYQMYWYNLFSWWWAWGCSKHVENWNKHIEKNCASSWSFTKNHKKMHGEQNIKFRKYSV